MEILKFGTDFMKRWIAHIIKRLIKKGTNVDTFVAIHDIDVHLCKERAQLHIDLVLEADTKDILLLIEQQIIPKS